MLPIIHDEVAHRSQRHEELHKRQEEVKATKGSHAEDQRAGRIRGAGLDLIPKKPVDPDHPPLQLPNVVATPHVAGVTFGTSFRQAQPVNENVKCVILRLPQSEPSYQGWLIDVRSFQQQHVTSVYE